MKRFLNQAPYLILLGGFAARLYHLGANSLWYDETVSLFLAKSELPELIRHTAGDIHPPLYYVLLHFWGRVAGWSEFSAAFLSLAFGVLLIALVYRVCREWFSSPAAPSSALSQSGFSNGSRSTAILAALVVAVSPYNIWYSQEVRMYTIGATLGLLSVYFLRRMMQSGKLFSRDSIAYAVVTVLGFYTLYYFIFLMVFEWLWVAIQLVRIAPRSNQTTSPTRFSFLVSRASTFLLSQLALVLLYLPWLAIAFRQATDPPVPPWREFIALPRVILETFSALAFGQAVDPNLFGWVALLLFIVIGLFAWRRDRLIQSSTDAIATGSRFAIRDMPSAIRNPPSPFFLLGCFLAPLATLYLFSLWKPLYHVRYMFTYSPAFYIFVAYGLVQLAKEFDRAQRANNTRLASALGLLGFGIPVGLLAITGYSLNNFWNSPQYAEDDLRGAVNYIADHWRPGDAILVNAGYAYPALVYYFPEPLTRERLVNYQRASGSAPLVLQTGSIGGAPNLGWGDPQSDFYATSAEETQAALGRVFANHPRVWMLRLYDTVVDPQGILRAYFDEHATLLDDQAFSGESQTRVQGFLTQTTRELPPTATILNQNLADRVELVGYETAAGEIERGGFFDAVLYWKLLQSVNYNYQVTLQLLNANGENVAQYDETPLSDTLPMTRWKVGDLYREPLRLKLPPTLPPGDYRAIVKLYEPRSGEVVGGVIELGGVQLR